MLTRPLLLAPLAALLALAAPPARAPGAPDARAILERVAGTYRTLTSFDFAGRVSVDMTRPGAHQAFEFPIIAAAVKPGRSRTEMRNPDMGLIVVSDGRTLPAG